MSLSRFALTPQHRSQESGDEQEKRAGLGYGGNQRIGTGDTGATIDQEIPKGDLAGVVERFYGQGKAPEGRTEERITYDDHFIFQRIGPGEDAVLKNSVQASFERHGAVVVERGGLNVGEWSVGVGDGRGGPAAAGEDALLTRIQPLRERDRTAVVERDERTESVE